MIKHFENSLLFLNINPCRICTSIQERESSLLHLVGRHNKKTDGIGWDGMGWDGTWYHGMGRDGIVLKLLFKSS